MTPTREQIEASYNSIVHNFPVYKNALDFMREAALSKLDSEPFNPGEVVVHDHDRWEILICTGEAFGKGAFCGVVISDQDSPVKGTYHIDWKADQFTRKTY